MSAPRRFILGLLAVVWIVGASLAADEPLSQPEIAKLGKAATALVDMKPRYATAFCVHPSGLFVTNDHVIRDSNTDTFTLVLAAGSKAEKSLKAKVIRHDKDLDLALLRVQGDEKLPALSLGTDDDLTELMELMAFGYPFGQALSVEKDEYPAVSVNVGKITALRFEKNKDLARIQLDAALNPGNSGGPLLDRKGKVVGVVVSGILGSGVNLAIPVSQVARFLARPDIQFTPPSVSAAKQHEAAEFVASATSVPPPEPPLQLELVLGKAGAKERRLPMKLVDGSYRVSAVPFPTVDGPDAFHAEIKYDDGVVSGLIEDQTFRVGDAKIKLSRVRSLHLGKTAKVELTSREVQSGALADLDALTVKVGDQTLHLNLAKALEINLDPPDEGTTLSCSVVARQGDKEVGRISTPMYLEGAEQEYLDAIRDGKFMRPARSGVAVSYMRAISTKGDYIGGGKTYQFGGDELVVRKSLRGVQIVAGGWNVLFSAPVGKFLDVGEYVDAKREPFSDTSPGIEFSGNGRGCNTISGKFVVWELEVKGNDVVRLAIDFTQHCEGANGPPLYGMIRVNSKFH